MIKVFIKVFINFKSYSEYIIKVKIILQEKFEDSKDLIRSRKSKKDRQHSGTKKKTKGQTSIHITLP